MLGAPEMSYDEAATAVINTRLPDVLLFRFLRRPMGTAASPQNEVADILLRLYAAFSAAISELHPSMATFSALAEIHDFVERLNVAPLNQLLTQLQEVLRAKEQFTNAVLFSDPDDASEDLSTYSDALTSSVAALPSSAHPYIDHAAEVIEKQLSRQLKVTNTMTVVDSLIKYVSDTRKDLEAQIQALERSGQSAFMAQSIMGTKLVNRVNENQRSMMDFIRRTRRRDERIDRELLYLNQLAKEIVVSAQSARPYAASTPSSQSVSPTPPGEDYDDEVTAGDIERLYEHATARVRPMSTTADKLQRRARVFNMQSPTAERLAKADIARIFKKKQPKS
jgi:hypothetical protein